MDKTIFYKTIEANLCLRECSTIIHIAEANDCLIQVTNKGKTGDTTSITSLVKLEAVKGDTIVFTISGPNQVQACHEVMRILEKGWEEEDIKYI